MPLGDGQPLPSSDGLGSRGLPMRAVVVEEYGAFNSALVRELPDPIPGPDEVIVTVKAAAVNFTAQLIVRGAFSLFALLAAES